MKFRFLLFLIYAFTAQPSEEVKLKLESMLPPGVNLNFYEDAQIDNFYALNVANNQVIYCLLYTSPSPRDKRQSRMPSSA